MQLYMQISQYGLIIICGGPVTKYIFGTLDGFLMSLHTLVSDCIYYEQINIFHFVKRTIDPTSLGVGGEKRSNSRPGSTFSTSSHDFSFVVSFIIQFWCIWSPLNAFKVSPTLNFFCIVSLSIFVLANICENFKWCKWIHCSVRGQETLQLCLYSCYYRLRVWLNTKVTKWKYETTAWLCINSKNLTFELLLTSGGSQYSGHGF